MLPLVPHLPRETTSYWGTLRRRRRSDPRTGPALAVGHLHPRDGHRAAGRVHRACRRAGGAGLRRRPDRHQSALAAAGRRADHRADPASGGAAPGLVPCSLPISRITAISAICRRAAAASSASAASRGWRTGRRARTTPPGIASSRGIRAGRCSGRGRRHERQAHSCGADPPGLARPVDDGGRGRDLGRTQPRQPLAAGTSARPAAPQGRRRFTPLPPDFDAMWCSGLALSEMAAICGLSPSNVSRRRACGACHGVPLGAADRQGRVGRAAAGPGDGRQRRCQCPRDPRASGDAGGGRGDRGGGDIFDLQPCLISAPGLPPAIRMVVSDEQLSGAGAGRDAVPAARRRRRWNWCGPRTPQPPHGR